MEMASLTTEWCVSVKSVFSFLLDFWTNKVTMNCSLNHYFSKGATFVTEAANFNVPLAKLQQKLPISFVAV